MLEMSYEELLQLNDETLGKKNVTMGARGKILKYIGHIRDRPNTLKQCTRDLKVRNIFCICVRPILAQICKVAFSLCAFVCFGHNYTRTLEQTCNWDRKLLLWFLI